MSKEILVEGFQRAGENSALLLSGDEWIDKMAWRRYFKQAWQVKMSGGMSVAWHTEAVPSDVSSDD